MNIRRLFLILAFTFCLAKLASADSIPEAAAQILDGSTSNADREKIIATHTGEAAELVSALARNLPANDSAEEYKRIPWIWRTAINAGKRNDGRELVALLRVSMPKPGEPLRDWQAVVIGGGIINGLTLQNIWPAERVAEVLRLDEELKLRWSPLLDSAAAMAENEKVKTGTRYDALRILGVDAFEHSGQRLSKYLAKGANAELQQGAVCALGDIKSKKAVALLLANLENLTEKNRNFALDALLRDDTRIAALLEAIEQKKIASNILGTERKVKLQRTANEKLRARAAKVLGAPIDSNAQQYSVGMAKVDVTPDYPIRLHGYLARKTESEGVAQHLFAKAIAIGNDKEGPAILISVDNCMVPEHIRTEVLRRLASKGITSDRFAVCSSHTHTAPKLAHVADNIFGIDIIPSEQAHIDRYTKELTDNMEKAALIALKDRKASILSWGKTTAGFAANRRTKGGPVDHDVPVLKVMDKEGHVRGLVVNYACHCTTLADQPNHISADWAGYAQEYIERDHPGAIAMTVMGCGADSNPAPRPGMDFAKQHGQEITGAVDELLFTKLTPLSAKLECRTKQIALDFDTLPTKEQLQATIADTKAHFAVTYAAKKNLARLERGEKLQSELPYLVQTWNFGDQLALVFLPGEVVVDYSLRLKGEFDSSRLWVNAYANDVPCYIPSKRIWKEGGYEGGGAMIYYDRPTRLAELTEDKIIAAVHEIMPKQFAAVENKSDGSKPTAAVDAPKTIRTKPGFTVDLAASEPQIVDPVAMDFMTDGKLLVVEMHDYPCGMDGDFKVPGGRVKLLSSSKNNGQYDKATTFVDGIPFPTGAMQWRKGVLICAAPDILYAEDTNGDGKADIVKKLYTGFFTNNFQARVNSLRWGLDNWVYAAAGLFGGTIHSEINGKDYQLSGRDFRFNPDTGDFEPVSGLTQQSRDRDDFGNWFGCDNSNFAWNFPMEERYVRRNPFVTAPEPRVNVSTFAEANKLFPSSHIAERFNHPESANRTTSACGLGVYRDTLLGDAFYGNTFTGETVHNMVRRIIVKNEGITVGGYKADDEQDKEFFASVDNWSRPAEIRTGPDGALWIADMYRQVVEHPRWIPAETLAKLDVRAGADQGRIFRVYPTGAKLRAITDLTKLPAAKLVALLETPNGITRDLIHRELYQRQDKEAVTALVKLSTSSKNPAVRVQALCILDGLKSLTPATLLSALKDPDARVRRQAVRLSETRFSQSNELAEALLKMATDTDIAVRFQLVLMLGEWNDPRAGKILGDLARENMGDHWMRAAVLSSAVHQPGEILKSVLASPAETPNRGELAGQLIATAFGSDNNAVLESVLVAIAPEKAIGIPTWQLTALANLQEALARKKLTLESFANSSNAELKQAVARIEAAIESAGVIARNTKANLAEREAAVRLLSGAKGEGELKTLVEFGTQTSNSRLQKAALASLRAQQQPKVSELLLAGWTQYSPSVREAILDILLSRDEGVSALLTAVENRTISPTEIPIVNRQQLQKHPNKGIQERAVKALPSFSSNRGDILKKFADVPKLAGNPEHGAALFAATCSSCHRLKGVGNSVGPDLAPLGDKPVDYLLTAILDPNAIIEPRFIQYNIETKDDRSLSGVIQNETATSLTLVQGGGGHEDILRSQVATMKASLLSLMPEGLEEGKSPQDFADLIAYVKSQPSKFGSASPEKAAESRKNFMADGMNGLSRVVSAAEKLDYPSWLGTLPLAHCRQTDGTSKVVWQSEPLKEVKPKTFYTFRLPIGVGFLSGPAGKFYLKVNGKSAVAFDVTTTDAVWDHPAHEVTVRYSVMENNEEDSNGVLTITVTSIWLEAGKPVTFEVTGSASNSQRWFGVYELPQQHATNR
ncbi:MAG: putative rane-bound dehydrogenase [Verrucomicrobiales bacterium]|nr:putative rane-bound dehydrogenase [Verrucomicrobiales bacterium]